VTGAPASTLTAGAPAAGHWCRRTASGWRRCRRSKPRRRTVARGTGKWVPSLKRLSQFLFCPRRAAARTSHRRWWPHRYHLPSKRRRGCVTVEAGGADERRPDGAMVLALRDDGRPPLLRKRKFRPRPSCRAAVNRLGRPPKSRSSCPQTGFASRVGDPCGGFRAASGSVLERLRGMIDVASRMRRSVERRP